MNAKLIVVLFLVALPQSHQALRAQSQREEKPGASRSFNKLEITAAKVNEDDSGKLSFVVKNGTPSVIRVVKDYLPWNTTVALKLLAVPFAKGTAAVEAVQPIEDPRATSMEIQANSELHGELDVSRFFTRWRELTRQGMLLVWSLSLYDIETGQATRFNGVIEYRAN